MPNMGAAAVRPSGSAEGPLEGRGLPDLRLRGGSDALAGRFDEAQSTPGHGHPDVDGALQAEAGGVQDAVVQNRLPDVDAVEPSNIRGPLAVDPFAQGESFS